MKRLLFALILLLPSLVQAQDTLTAPVTIITGSPTPTLFRADGIIQAGHMLTSTGQQKMNLVVSPTVTNPFTTGYGNCILFQQSGYNITSGVYNTLIGPYSGSFITSGSSNVGLGANVLMGVTTTSTNTALGNDALAIGVGVSGSVAVGFAAGYTSTGYGNVYVGKSSGMYHNSGNGFTAIGYYAGNAATFFANTNGTYVGNQTEVNDPNEGVFGGIGVRRIYFGLGKYDQHASNFPTTFTISVPSVLASGNLMNYAPVTNGSSLYNVALAGSRGTGTGIGGDVYLQISGAGTSGNNLNGLVTKVAVKGGSGLVGINTVTPSSQLDVSGDIETSGSIYFGDPSTDGTYKIVPTSSGLEIQKRVSGTYITIQTY